MGKIEKLKWKVVHNSDFSREENFLETILEDCGVKDIKTFLRPLKNNVLDPFTMLNMDKAVELVHSHLAKGSKIFVKVDPDVDGWSSSSALIQFLKAIKPDVKIEYMLNYEKKHGLTFEDLANFTSDEFGLYIVPDASMTVADARQIKNNFNGDILVLDHHIVEDEFYDNLFKKWINKEEVKAIYDSAKNEEEIKNRIETDCYTNYCLCVNCTDGNYQNPCLSGVGVVQKFIEAYLSTWGEIEDLDMSLSEEFLDLVSLGINADSMDLQSLESRYYVLEGMKEYNCKNEFINELVLKNEEDMKWGRYIVSMSWVIAPKINGMIRYGKPEEQLDGFRAILEEHEDREYQPRRKSKNDPKPEIEIHSLQKTMARVAGNIKSRQDTEVRKFVKLLNEEIKEKELDKNSILFVDGTKILTKSTVTGLVANKLASAYYRPVVLLRENKSDVGQYGGSCRGYDKGNIPSIKDFLGKAGVEIRGHSNAGGVFLPKADLQKVIDKCNEMMPIDQLCTIHTVDWEIPANKLKKEYVQEVAENYAVWGSTVPEPLFAITNLRINASKINGYGEHNGFIRFVYGGIVFTKKYCSFTDFDEMTLKDRNTLGINKKDLVLNIIGQFVLNSWEDKINPEVKILYFDSTEDTTPVDKNINTMLDIEETPKKVKPIDNDDDFDW